MRVLKLIYKIYKIHCSLYEAITVNDKIYNMNLLLNSSSVLRQNCAWRLMVLKEVTIDFTALYMCVNCTRKVYSLQLTAYLQMFVKSNIVTGYLLIQVEIVSVYALAGLPKFFVDFLVPGVCGRSWTISSVGAGTGPSATGAGPSAAGASSAISAFSSCLSEKYRIRHRRSIWCCHEDKVR